FAFATVALSVADDRSGNPDKLMVPEPDFFGFGHGDGFTGCKALTLMGMRLQEFYVGHRLPPIT
ncbi:hypothetical protein IAW11_005006, partial [Salmonella enterica]|nr:hypothetical protein [Salmonella enterica]